MITKTLLFRLENISKIFHQGEKKIVVLNALNLILNPGEIVGLIGASGSGKSTLLHLCGLLDQPTTGNIFLDEQNLSKISEQKKNDFRKNTIGFVYQQHCLLPEFSALENVALPKLLLGTSYKKALDEAKEHLKILGLAHRLNHFPSELSGGEQQRTSLARALSNHPKIIFADEPTGNLDPTTTKVHFSEMIQILREFKMTALIATHDMSLLSLFDRVCSLENGELS